MKVFENIVNIIFSLIGLPELVVGFVALGLISGFFGMGLSDSWQVNPMMKQSGCEDKMLVEVEGYSESLSQVKQ